MKDFLDADDNAETSCFHPIMVLLTFLARVNECTSELEVFMGQNSIYSY
jgi:hypothetical protein